MSDTIDESVPRFDVLVGRFFDGLLTDSEDQELVLLLDFEPELAKRFLVQVEVERILILQGDPRRVSSQAFIDSVSRGIQLIKDSPDSQRFAKQVAELIHNTKQNPVPKPLVCVPLDAPANSTGSNPGSSRRRKIQRLTVLSPWVAAASLAALVAITVLVTRDTAPTTPDTKGLAVVTVPEPRAEKPSNSTVELPRTIVTPNGMEVTVQHVPPEPIPEPVDFFKDEEPTLIEPAVAATAPSKQPTPSTPKKKPIDRVVSRPEASTLSELGRVAPAVGCSAVLRRGGTTGGEMSVNRLELAGEGDLIRVGPLEASPSDAVAEKAGCELQLTDGTRIWLKPNSALRIQRVKGAFRPVLETGEALVHAAKQKPEAPLAILTAQGTEARVLGTVFRVQAEPQNKRVMLYVEEGKVMFSAKGEERLVLADEACLIEDGKGPTFPYQYRPRACTLAGTVLEAGKNTPVAGVTVIAAPVAQLGSTPIQYKTETNAQGKYSFDTLPEGPAFVYVMTEDGGGRVKGRGTVARTRIEPNTKNTANVLLDVAIPVDGRVLENGKALTDYRVRLVRQGSDGLTFNAAESGTFYWVGANDSKQDGFTFVAMEGAGRYTPIVEKKGQIAKLRYGNVNDLRIDRNMQWFMDATFTPSAQLKGRVAGASGATLADDPKKLTDPHRARSQITLKSATGQTQVLLADANGEFLFDTNLSTGLYELRVERFGYQADVRRLNLVEGKTLDLTVALKTAPVPYRIGK